LAATKLFLLCASTENAMRDSVEVKGDEIRSKTLVQDLGGKPESRGPNLLGTCSSLKPILEKHLSA
jgi:hypothetical protein